MGSLCTKPVSSKFTVYINDITLTVRVLSSTATAYLPTIEMGLSLKDLFQVGVGSVSSSIPPTPRAPQSTLPQHNIELDDFSWIGV